MRDSTSNQFDLFISLRSEAEMVFLERDLLITSRTGREFHPMTDMDSRASRDLILISILCIPSVLTGQGLLLLIPEQEHSLMDSSLSSSSHIHSGLPLTGQPLISREYLIWTIERDHLHLTIE